MHLTIFKLFYKKDFLNVGLILFLEACSYAYAIPISLGSVYAAPKKENPTGKS